MNINTEFYENLKNDFHIFKNNKEKISTTTRYPQHLKFRVLTASKKGFSISDLNKLTGVSKGTLRQWTGQKKTKGSKEIIGPRRLNLINNGLSQSEERDESINKSYLAEIYFKSGIKLKFNFKDLDGHTISALNKEPSDVI